MTNPINPFSRSSTSSIGSNTGKAASSKSSNVDSPSSGGSSASEDTVSLSSQSRQVIELQKQLKNAPEIDSSKIEAIRQEIANGNYPLDAEKIAESMINLEKSLIE